MASINLRDGLVGEWHFNGNLKDTSGAGNDAVNTGSCTVAADEEGRLATAYEWNGSSTYMTVDNAALTILGQDYTVFERFKFTDATNFSIQMTKTWSASTGKLWSLNTGATNTRLSYYGAGKDADVSWTPSVDTWYTLAATWDTSTGTFELYIDGEYIGNATCTEGTAGLDAYDIRFGWNGYTGYSEGVISDIAMWQRKLSAEEIKQHHNEIKPHYQPIFEHCDHYWDLRGDAADLIGGTVGVETDTTDTTNRLGQTDSAMTFNGSSSKIDTNVAGYGNGTTAITVAAWCMVPSSAGNDAARGVVDRFSSGTDTVFTLGFQDGFARFLCKDEDGTNVDAYLGSGTDWRDDEWHLIIGTFGENEGAEVFIDTTSIATGTTTNKPLETATVDVNIGVYQRGPVYFTGDIGEVWLFNAILSTDQIDELYNLTKNKYITPFSQGGKE